MKYLMFIYGTLKQGFPRNAVLENSRYLGTAISTKNYVMFKIGVGKESYPGLVEDNHPLAVSQLLSNKIAGELYEVDEKTLTNLDVIEGVEFNLFAKQDIVLESSVLAALPTDPSVYSMVQRNVAWAYFYQGPIFNTTSCGSLWT